MGIGSGSIRTSLADPVGLLDAALARPLVWRAAVAALFLLQAALILTHAHWLDEWQALQIATGSRDTATLFENLRYEGHPPLWYWVLQALSTAFPFPCVLKAALLPLAFTGQALILWRAPFTRGERLLIASGALMLFEYFTLSRSLSLGVMLLLVLIACWHTRRAPWLLIALLPLTDFLFGVLSLLAVAGRGLDGRIWRPGVALWIGCGVFAAWSVRPAGDLATALNDVSHQLGLLIALANLGTILVPWQADGWVPVWNSALPFHLGLAACPLFLYFGHCQLRGDRASLAAFWLFIALLTAFSAMVYSLHFRHISLAGLLIILLRWRLGRTGAKADRWFRLWLLTGAIVGLAMAAIALRTPFDRAPDVADWIARAGLADDNWLAFPESRGQSVGALGQIDFVRLDHGCRTSFVRWNKGPAISNKAEFEKRLTDFVAEHGPAYMVSDRPLDQDSAMVQRIATFAQGYDGQDYYLFALRVPGPERGRPIPYCTPSMRFGNGPARD
jgi:hypothetical protein